MKIAIVGLGFVGLSLAVVLASKNIVNRTAKTADKMSSALTNIASKSIDKIEKNIVYPGINDTSSKSLSDVDQIINLLKNSKK